MSTPSDRTFTRRALLGGGLALLATGCSTVTQAPIGTVAGLLDHSPFYIAHRGGGDNWPEMTRYAYDQAARLPDVRALEISVCRSADGILVCSHDPTTLRMTGVDLTIGQQPWSVLSGLQVTAAYTRDPSQPEQPLSRFDEVIERHIDRLVVFVEPKTPEAVGPLMDRMAALGHPDRVVWKQPVNQPNFRTAKDHGFGTWGYVLNERGHQGERLEKFAATDEIDLLGAQRTQPEALVRKVMDAAGRHDKKVVMWPIRNVAHRDYALSLGCAGLMTSNVIDVPTAPR